MRLADFIEANKPRIIAEWELFAHTREPAARSMAPLALRDHIDAILDAIVRDMRTPQTRAEQAEKSMGRGRVDADGVRAAGQRHAVMRAASGFDLTQLASEFRALRASVLRLWSEVRPTWRADDIPDMTRFNEAVDQTLSESLSEYTHDVDRARELFLAILGHDLRAPLGAISMSAESLTRAADLAPHHRRAATRIMNGATRMTLLISDLLDLTRTRLGGRIPIHRVSGDLESITRRAVDELEAVHPGRIVGVAPQGDLDGSWDGPRISQVIANLVGNAVQHGAAGTPIEVSVHGEPQEVVLAVHNEGPPIPPEARETIFEPLVQGRRDAVAEPTQTTSLGLGLYIAREIVTACGGRIEVASTAEDGTTFTVHLPRHPEAAAS